MVDVVAHVEETVLRSGVLRPGEELLVAVSGGQDSVALLFTLHSVRQRLGLRLAVAHVNHGLRGEESDRDSKFVQELGTRLALPVYVRRVRVPAGAGVEERARTARLSALRAIAHKAGADRIALGHTATDRAETVLMNILRGAGLEGLAALPASSRDLVRPLLGVTRAETAAYCAARGVEPRQDHTNLDQRILRNRIRLSLLPLLEQEYQPRISEALVRLAEIAEAELDWTRLLVHEALQRAVTSRDRGLALSLDKLSELPRGLRTRVLREAVGEARGDLQRITFEHVQSLSSLVDGRTGARVKLPGLWAERTAEMIVLTRPARLKAREFEVSLTIPGEVKIPDIGLALSAEVRPLTECDITLRGPMCAHLDAAVTGYELVVRSRRRGDRITPLGMTGRKKLHDLLIDKKIPRFDRECIPVVARPGGEILWVVGHVISERAKVNETTREVVQLTARPLVGH